MCISRHATSLTNRGHQMLRAKVFDYWHQTKSSTNIPCSWLSFFAPPQSIPTPLCGSSVINIGINRTKHLPKTVLLGQQHHVGCVNSFFGTEHLGILPVEVPTNRSKKRVFVPKFMFLGVEPKHDVKNPVLSQQHL